MDSMQQIRLQNKPIDLKYTSTENEFYMKKLNLLHIFCTNLVIFRLFANNNIRSANLLKNIINETISSLIIYLVFIIRFAIYICAVPSSAIDYARIGIC